MNKIFLITLTLISVFCLVQNVQFLEDTQVKKDNSKNGDPVPKVWPNQWESEFLEDTYVPILGTIKTKGKWVYDLDNQRFFISRENGKNDRYCGSIYKLRSTSCNQIVLKGVRYFHFPEKKFCCKCCDASKGCGMVTNNWFTFGEYSKKTTMSNQDVLEYIIKGVQSNYYDETTEGVPIRIYQEPLSDMMFDTSTYKEGISDASVFDLPKDSGNCEQSCGFTTICKLLS
jgi:hypothetical protein